MGKELVFKQEEQNELTRLTARLNVFQAVLQDADLQQPLEFYLKNADAIVPFSYGIWIKRMHPEGNYQESREAEINRIFNRDLQIAQRFQTGVSIKGEQVNDQWKTITIGPEGEKVLFLQELIGESEARIAEIELRSRTHLTYF